MLCSLIHIKADWGKVTHPGGAELETPKNNKEENKPWKKKINKEKKKKKTQEDRT